MRNDVMRWVVRERCLCPKLGRLESDDADFDIASNDLAGDATGHAALDFDPNVGMTRAAQRNQRQEGHYRVFIGPDRKLGTRKIAEVFNRRMCMKSQIHHLLYEIKKHASRRRQSAVL